MKPAYSASGCRDGAASAKAGSASHAASIAIRRGKREADVGEARRGAEAEGARGKNERLARLQSPDIGVRHPGHDRGIIEAAAAQFREDGASVQRVRIRREREREREGADAGAQDRVARKERGRRVGFLEPFDDGERLGQHDAVAELQRRKKPLGVHRQIGRRAMLAAAQVNRDIAVGQPLEVEGDSHSPRGGTEEMAVELHGIGSAERCSNDHGAS